jgi:hypothetical protein
VYFDVNFAQHVALIQALDNCWAPGSTCLQVRTIADPTSLPMPALVEALTSIIERLEKHAQQAG